jgi:hypothetical protein
VNYSDERITVPRTPGKYGRRSPKRAAAPQLKNYLTGVLPVVPANDDYLAELGGGWQMLGNDTAGDCVAVTWANVRRLVTALLGSATDYPTQSEVWAFYETQNPGFNPNGSPQDDGPGSADDNGMDIQTAIEDLIENGGPDGVKAVGYAAVDYTSPAEVKAAIALFGYVWTGINVLDVNTTEFADGQPWNYDASSPVDGGHSIVTGGYGAPGAGPLGGDERFITWAEETSFTDAFWSHQVEEAWVVIWPEHLGSKDFLAGVNMTQLAADYQEITGKPWPASVTPVPPPVPAPSPAPVPPENLVTELVDGLEKFLKWLRSLV